ncbi:30S ribosomal protein S2 [Candidatus Roizmanbacteria bacterium]|nr:30S ribosomal protein S2 [Candidatus Roizmanbacteria bacterium]
MLRRGKEDFMKPVDLKTLLEAGCHFGHKVNKWNPRASSFIYKAVGDTHIIDLTKTKEGLEVAADFIIQLVGSGKEIVFVGTKRQASSLVKEQAERVGAPYLNRRWIGGFVTNWFEVKKNLEKLNTLKKQRNDKSVITQYTKRERLLMDREMQKLDGNYGGVAMITEPPAAIVIVDTKKEITAVREAKQKGIILVGIVDTNSNPDIIDYVIPANDDAVGSITLILSYLADAYAEGKKKAQRNQEQKEKEMKKQKSITTDQDTKATKSSPEKKDSKKEKPKLAH